MPITQRTTVLNTFGLERRERISADGTGMGIRYSVSVEATPMIHRFDAKELGRAPAVAIATHLRERVEAIGVDASAATLRRRAAAKLALEKGEATATKRYGGGRIGVRPPAKSTKLFNDSGRFAEGIYAAVAGNGYTINFPANRFDPSTFEGGEAGVMKLFVQLRQYVPEFGDASQLATVASIRRAIQASSELIISRSGWTSSGGAGVIDLGERRRAMQLDAIRAALELASQIAA